MHEPAQVDGQALRQFLAERDIPCPGCGYNLRGLARSLCPECARPFTLQELLPPTSLGPNTPLRIAVVVELAILAVLFYLMPLDPFALACPLGFAAFFLGIMALSAILSRRHADPSVRRREHAWAAWTAVGVTVAALAILGGLPLIYR